MTESDEKTFPDEEDLPPKRLPADATLSFRGDYLPDYGDMDAAEARPPSSGAGRAEETLAADASIPTNPPSPVVWRPQRTQWVRETPAPAPAPSAASPPAPPPDREGLAELDYQIHGKLGEGGNGEVWEATQQSLRRRIAIKRLRRDLLERTAGTESERQLRDTFRQEALTTANLEHPNIIPVYDLGMDDQGQPLLALKLVRGKPWSEILLEDRKLPAADFLSKHLPVLIDVAQAVAFAHSRGVIHRDLKPSQVMIGEFGEAILTDWGLSVILPPHPEQARSTLSQDIRPLVDVLATASNPAGTPAFMAPEQTEKTLANIGPWTDVFLLGGILYFLLTRTPPRDTTDAVQAFIQARYKPVPPPEERAPGAEIPMELSALVMRTLSRTPGERPAVKEFIAGLNDFLTGAGNRRESVAILRQVERNFESEPRNYRNLSECLVALARAEGLWPGNLLVRPLREQIQEASARFALEKGDLHLASIQAERMEDPRRREDLLEIIARAQRAQERAARERRLAFALAALFLLALIAGGWLYARNQRAARLAAEKAGQEARRQQSLAEAASREAGAQRHLAEQARHAAEREQYFSVIGFADAFLREGRAQVVSDQLLNHTPADFRHWEWGRLIAGVNRDLFLLQKGVTFHELFDASFSPDGRRLVSASRAGEISLWNADTTELLWRRKVHEKGIWRCVFSPDGTKLLTASFDTTAKILDAQTGDALLQLSGHTMLLRGAAWSHDSRRVVTTARDLTARVWDAATGDCLITAKFPSHPYDADFSPDDQRIAVATLDSGLYLISPQTGEILKTFTPVEGNALCARFDPAGRRLAATASRNRAALVFDVESGATLHTFLNPASTFHCVLFSPDGRLIAGSDNAGILWLWDAESGRLLDRYFSAPLMYKVSFSPDGQRLLTVSDTEIRVWPVRSPERPAEEFAPERIAETDIPPGASPDFLRINSLPYDRSDIWQDRDKVWIEPPGRSALKVGGHYYLVDSHYKPTRPDGAARIEIDYNSFLPRAVKRGEEQGIPLGEEKVFCARFSPSGRLAATGNMYGAAQVWDTDTWRLIANYDIASTTQTVYCLAFSPDDSRLAAGMVLGEIHLIDLKTGARRKFSAHQKATLALEFDSRGERLLTSSSDNTAKLWSAAEGRLLQTYRGHREFVISAVFSPDERRVLTCANDSTVKLWDTETGRELLTVREPPLLSSPLGAAFSRDGMRILLPTTTGNLIVLETFPWNETDYPEPTQSDLPKRMELWKRRHRLDPAAQWSSIGW